VRKLISVIALLLPVLASADQLGLNNVPLFWNVLGENPMYHDAAFKAQEAFLIQTGVTPAADKLSGYVTTKATNTVTTFVDKDTPLDSKTLFFLIGAMYAVGVKKHVQRSFRDPFLPFVRHTVDVSPDTQSTGISISF
jgi:hypothetical protein